MFDLHVHTAPDLEERFGDDVEIVRLYEHAGSSGCVLKGHYDATAGRARAAGVARRSAFTAPWRSTSTSAA